MRHLFFALMAVTITYATPSFAKLKVVASFSILGDMVNEIAGDKIELTEIVGPDADAHLYMPNASDAIAVAQADLIFVNGLGFETWSQDLIATSGTDAEIVSVTDKVEPLLVEGSVDPHAWNALGNGVLYAKAITAGLSKADPANAEQYQAASADYIARLQALDKKAAQMISLIPQDKRVVVTAHDAFGYLADSYDMTFLAPVGIDTEDEPSAKELASLISYLKEVKAQALFVENITNRDLVSQIASETGLSISGQLYSDALSIKGSPATSYIAMYEHNLTTIITALSSQP